MSVNPRQPAVLEAYPSGGGGGELEERILDGPKF